MTWSGGQAVVNELIAGLNALGVRPGEKAGILSETRWEWLAADWAILGLGAVSVPIYASQTADTIAYMLNDSQTAYIFVENAEQYAKIASIRASVPTLKAIILLDDAAEVRSESATARCASSRSRRCEASAGRPPLRPRPWRASSRRTSGQKTWPA